MTVTRVLLVDDHPVFRLGLERLITADGGAEVVGSVATGEAALDLLDSVDADLVLVDLGLPGIDGLELVRRARAAWPDLAMLVLSTHPEERFAERAIRAGARGYVMKDARPSELLDAIRRAAQGELVLSTAQSEVIARRSLLGADPAHGHPAETLSSREREVFELTGEGLGTRQVAERLGIAIKTVETHKAHIKRKLGVKTATELVREAVSFLVAYRPATH